MIKLTLDVENIFVMLEVMLLGSLLPSAVGIISRPFSLKHQTTRVYHTAKEILILIYLTYNTLKI